MGQLGPEASVLTIVLCRAMNSFPVRSSILTTENRISMLNDSYHSMLALSSARLSFEPFLSFESQKSLVRSRKSKNKARLFAGKYFFRKTIVMRSVSAPSVNREVVAVGDIGIVVVDVVVVVVVIGETRHR